ncbi:MAG: hypothetical protein HZA60_09545 [Deltaproteobacteria bacterium]|nr:hypothetical protein [Deltaproteobacteria bacterium]
MPINDAIRAAAPRPGDHTSRPEKKNYAERLSNEVAKVVALRLRDLGVAECQPGFEGGKERQFAGGIGAKKVDVSFATETAGLVLGISIKSISFPDPRTKNYSKNLTNRRGDLLAEATTLHQRFPYAVLGGLFLFDIGASLDGTDRRPGTVTRAHEIFEAFTNRDSRSNAVEKYEHIGIVVYKASDPIGYEYFDVGAAAPSSLDSFLLHLLERVAERNSDHYRFDGKKLEQIR